MLDLNDKLLSKKLPAFNFVAEINNLCKPFFQACGANYFDYNRIYHDNSFLTLTSDGHWLEHFLERKYKFCTAFQRSGTHLWDSYYYQLAIHDAKINFNHDHGITIIYQRNNFIEYVDIAAPSDHRIITSFYLNHFDQIENFIASFIKNSADLLALCEKKLIKLPATLCALSNEQLSISRSGMSNRETQCLNYFLAGHTAKETAEILQLSHRTVEEYINKIKHKLKCKNKRDLLKIFNNQYMLPIYK